MRIDHVSYAAEPDGMEATAQRLASMLGVRCEPGGNHPRFGTRNMVIPLMDARYIEVVEVLDHPACDKEPYGQAVRARSTDGGGWFAWVVSMDRAEFEDHARRLDKTPYPGMRRRPDGVEVSWEQLGAKGLLNDPQLPYFVTFSSAAEMHPSRVAPAQAELKGVTIAGDATRLRAWLGLENNPEGEWEKPIDFEFVMPHGTPGLAAVTFNCPKGRVTI